MPAHILIAKTSCYMNDFVEYREYLSTKWKKSAFGYLSLANNKQIDKTNNRNTL